MDAAKLRVDSLVEVREQRGRIVIEPVKETELDLDSLVAAITKENLHGEADFGPAVGKDAL
jgi:antitoxin MazE